MEPAEDRQVVEEEQEEKDGEENDQRRAREWQAARDESPSLEEPGYGHGV
jgi:hypothetical protein